MTWQENTGRCPEHLIGTNKRVAVKLRDGTKHGLVPVSSYGPRGWPANGKGACRWHKTGCRADIIEYKEL